MAEDKELTIARAHRAAALLDDDLIKGAYDLIEADLIQAWIGSEPRDSDGRERVWNMIHANRKHRDYLQRVINDGKIASAELKALIEADERKRPGTNR
jgi:hypothetical protein